VIDEAIRCLILKLGGKEDKSSRLYGMFQILLKANVSAAVLRDSHGRYLLHYACRHLRSISCATKIIEALLVAHKEAAMGIDSDECYAVTTAGNHSFLFLYLYNPIVFFISTLTLTFIYSSYAHDDLYHFIDIH
jgi:hypothetical protein